MRYPLSQAEGPCLLVQGLAVDRDVGLDAAQEGAGCIEGPWGGGVRECPIWSESAKPVNFEYSALPGLYASSA